MKELHWLNVQEWIEYKMLVAMYQCVNDLAPSFLTNLLDLYLTRKHLRSDSQGKLPIPCFSLSKFVTVQSDMQDQDYGMNYHNICGVQIHLETFKSLLKTHLFKKFYHH